MPEFVLGKRGGVNSPIVSLTADEFERARKAKATLVEALGVEERFNLFVENYVEWEQHLLSSTLQTVVHPTCSWSEFQGRIHTTNRRLFNLLAAGRLYVDHLQHVVSTIFGQGPELDHIRAATSDEYDSRLGYRAMEALRNFSQHRGWGVHHLSESAWRDGDTRHWKHGLVPSVRPAYLREEGRFKSSVLKELEGEGETVDLRPLVREYVTGIACVHGAARERLEKPAESADAVFRDLSEQYLPGSARFPYVARGGCGRFSSEAVFVTGGQLLGRGGGPRRNHPTATGPGFNSRLCELSSRQTDGNPRSMKWSYRVAAAASSRVLVRGGDTRRAWLTCRSNGYSRATGPRPCEQKPKHRASFESHPLPYSNLRNAFCDVAHDL